MKDRRAALCFELTALLAEGKAPEWVQLLPAGPKVMGRDGRWWLLSDPEGVAAASLSDRDRLPIDWEHSTEKKALYGEPAPAAGWITQMDVREGAIWGKVEWNDRGREMVEAKEYRYLSPVFNYELEGMEIVRLTSAGLTNSPNFDMHALNRAEETPMEFLKKTGNGAGTGGGLHRGAGPGSGQPPEVGPRDGPETGRKLPAWTNSCRARTTTRP